MSFRESLKGWLDIDVAQYELGISIGLIEPKYNFHSDTKHVFWCDNPVGNALYKILEELVDAGVLEKNQDRLQYRWNPDFRGSWE